MILPPIKPGVSIPSETEVTEIKRQFKRCHEAVIEAIIRYRGSHSLEEVPVILRGIMERYLRGPVREQFSATPLDTELTSLGLESLTTLEIILDVQEALVIQISDEELRPIRTLGDVQNLVLAKVSALPPP